MGFQTFKKWIIKYYLNTNTGIADLAADIKIDKNFPNTSNYNKLKYYFDSVKASRECKSCFEEAYIKYKKRGLL